MFREYIGSVSQIVLLNAITFDIAILPLFILFLNTKAMLSQRKPRDAAVNFDSIEIYSGIELFCCDSAAFSSEFCDLMSYRVVLIYRSCIFGCIMTRTTLISIKQRHIVKK